MNGIKLLEGKPNVIVKVERNEVQRGDLAELEGGAYVRKYIKNDK